MTDADLGQLHETQQWHKENQAMIAPAFYAYNAIPRALGGPEVENDPDCVHDDGTPQRVSNDAQGASKCEACSEVRDDVVTFRGEKLCRTCLQDLHAMGVI